MIGCAALSSFINTPTAEQIIVMDVVELGAGSILDAVPASQRAADANAVIAAAKAVQAVASSTQVALSDLQGAVATELAKTQLTPIQQQLIGQIVDTAAVLGASKISNGVLNPATVTSVTTVMGWVITGATPYASQAAAQRFALKARPLKP
jgi:hypothetical protein